MTSDSDVAAGTSVLIARSLKHRVWLSAMGATPAIIAGPQFLIHAEDYWLISCSSYAVNRNQN